MAPKRMSSDAGSASKPKEAVTSFPLVRKWKFWIWFK